MPDYSIIVPVFNSNQSLKELHQRLAATMKNLHKTFHLILVDDGSTDTSWQVMQELKTTYPQEITAIRLAKNYGQHNATLCGIAKAEGEYVITIDDDLQQPPEEIEKLILHMHQRDADLVYGIYSKKQHSMARNASSAFIKGSGKHLFNKKGEGSSFRLMKSHLAKSMLNHRQNFVYLDELFYWYTNHIEFVKINHVPRPYQKSNYTPRSLFFILSNVVIYYTSLPLQLMVYGGMISSIISFLIGMVFIYRKIVRDVPLGFTALIVAILFSTSIILLSLGVISEYLSRIYMVQNHKPPYAIKELLD
ncbi:MAG: glycosyltransferase family 2 protein [Lentimicrobiaceae bacterium]|nr:glycosyltransferase family 2 protein [Lentimicrobiaceae bacterium]